MIEIECPSCQSVGKMSLAQTLYEGPYRCWKCRDTFKIVLANNRLQSIEPITEQELDHLQQLHKMTKRDDDD